MQFNLPNLFVPGEFYIANVGGATSSGVEFELNARVHPNVDVFGGIGYTKAEFKDDSISGGVPVGGNTVPNTPDYTASLGIQLSRNLSQGTTLYGRAEATFSGAFEYDDLNTERQDAYSLANFRAGVRGRLVFVEGWIRNAFDTQVHPDGVRVRPAGAVWLHRRNGTAEDVWHLGRSGVLRMHTPEAQGTRSKDSQCLGVSVCRVGCGCGLCCLCCRCSAAQSPSTDWPQWRGPERNGVSRGRPGCCESGRGPARRWPGRRRNWEPAMARSRWRAIASSCRA